jgi:hypothetical protein
VIRYNFIPIDILNEKYVLTCSKNLEGYLIENKKNVKVKLYIGQPEKDIECVNIILNNIVVFGSDLIESEIKPDCYIDLLSGLILIKFDSYKLNFIKITNNLNCDIDLRYSEEKINLKYIWTDKNLEQKHINKFTKILNVWSGKYINLPPIPLMIDTDKYIDSEHNQNDSKPITGSAVYDDNNNFLGIVSYINQEEIIITPLISIKKIFDYMIYGDMLYLGLDLIPIKFEFKLGLNNIDYLNGLIIINEHYNDIIKKKNEIKKKIKKIQNQGELLSTENIIGDFELLIIKDTNINQNNSEYMKDTNNIEKKNLIEYDKLLQLSNNYKNLKKGNIICAVDNYKINFQGEIIINEYKYSKNKKKYKTIPFKSYIWFFKNSMNNTINFINIYPNNYYLDINKRLYENNKYVINDTHIKKQVKLIDSTIQIMTKFKSISTLDYSELKYITHDSIKLVELNEKLLEIIKKLVINNRKYFDLINEIFNDKFTFIEKKILMVLDFSYDEILPDIKIITDEIKNFDDFLSKYACNNKQKDFLLSIK